jgi:hypothetical protein
VPNSIVLKEKLSCELFFSFLLLIFVSCSLHGQVKDSVVVLKELQGVIHIDCKAKKNYSSARSYSKEDSLDNCLLIKTFKTDYKDVFYLKEYDLKGQLREEGFGKTVWDRRKFLGLKLKPVSSIVPDGKWKFYDSNGHKISDCCYSNGQLCMNCLWIEFDEQGNKIGEYKMEMKK